MSQEMNMNEKPKLERKKTPLRDLNADKTVIVDDQLGGQSYGQDPIAKSQGGKWKEPTAFDPSKPITDKPAGQGRTIEITEVEYRFPEAGKEKYGEGMPKGDFSDKPVTKDAEWTEDQQRKPAEWSEGQQKPGVWQEAKDKVRHGVEKTKEAFTSDKPTTTITPDSELTENKPGLIDRVKGVFTGPTDKDSGYTENKPGVIQGAKNMVWQGVEKAKGVFSSTSIKRDSTELHPGNGYNWKRVVGDQGQVCWTATNDWSGDSANRGGILEGAKSMVRSGVEKAKGVFSSQDAKESEYTGSDQPLTQDQSKPGVLQGAKDKVLQGVEKAKSVFSSSSAPTEATTTTTTTTPIADVPTVEKQQPTGYQKIQIEKEYTPSGFGREKMTVEKSADPQFKNQTAFKEQTGTDYSS